MFTCIGAISYEDLRSFEGQLYNTFKEACRARGLLQDDREWLLCLQEGAHFQTGFQLRRMFAIIVANCDPGDVNALWLACKNSLCDDLQHHLITNHRIPEPTQEQIYDYGLYLIVNNLQRLNWHPDRHPDMPRPQFDWGCQEGNQLIAEQRAFNQPELQEFIQRGELTLSIQQRALYQAVLDSVEQGQGGLFFLHSGGGCGKTYLSKLISAAVRARDKIVLCVASTGLASLLLPGGRTSHSRFKIPIPVNEQSTCNIKKNDTHHQLLEQTSLIIWDEVASQHRHVVECVDRSMKDLMSRNQPFGGITTLFGGDFRQTLPVVPHGSREQIVSAALSHSNLWRNMRVHYLHQNMRLGQDPECDQWAQRLLEIGITDGEVELPEHMHCGDDIESLITSVYGDLLDPGQNGQLPDQYFLDRTILTPRNAEVHELNSTILNRVSGEKKDCLSVDSVSNKEYEYIPQCWRSTVPRVLVIVVPCLLGPST